MRCARSSSAASALLALGLARPAAAEPTVVADLNRAPGAELPSVGGFVDLPGGREAVVLGPDAVWMTDGTPEGTRAVHPLPWWSGRASGEPVGAAVEGGVVLPLWHRGYGSEPFLVDAGGATRVGDLLPGGASGAPRQIVPLGGGALMSSEGPSNYRDRPYYSTRQLFRWGPDGLEHLLGTPEAPVTYFAAAPDAGEGEAWVAAVGRSLGLWRVRPTGPPRAVDVDGLLPNDARLSKPVLLGSGRDVWLSFLERYGPTWVVALGPGAPRRLLELPEGQVVQLERFGDELLCTIWNDRGDDPRVLWAHPPSGRLEVLSRGAGFRRLGPTSALVSTSTGASRFDAGEGLTALPAIAPVFVSDAAEDRGGLVVSGLLRSDRRQRRVARVRADRLEILYADERGAPIELHAALGQIFFSGAADEGPGLYAVDEDRVRFVDRLTRSRTRDFSPREPTVLGDRLFVRGRAENRASIASTDGTSARLDAADGWIVGRAGERVVTMTTSAGDRAVEARDATGEITSVLAAEPRDLAYAGVRVGSQLFFRLGLIDLWLTDGLSARRAAGPSFGHGSAGAPLFAVEGGVVLSNSQRGWLHFADGASSRPLGVRAGYAFTVGAGDRFFIGHRGLERVDLSGGSEVLVEQVDWARDPQAGDGFQVVVGERLFAATRGGLVVTDGTREDTVEIPLGDPDDRLEAAIAFRGALVFTARDDEAGYELWTSDGTPAGTRRLVDVLPGPGDGDPAAFLEVEGYLLFAANTEHQGREIFVSDGTAAGTRLLYDAAPGPGGVDPTWLARAGDRVFFDGDDRELGREIWSFSWSEALDEIEGRSPDAGVAADGSASLDAALPEAPDAGLDPTGLPSAAPGCGCRAARRPAGDPWSLLAGLILVLAAALRRRASLKLDDRE